VRLANLALAAGQARQVRDLAVWSGDGDTVFVAACDVNAGVGERPGDCLRLQPEEAGFSAAKVALMEVLAAGAEPFLVIDALCGPLDEYGRRVVDGVRRAMRDADANALLLGSDETNMTTVQTGVGVTVVGSSSASRLLLGRSRPGAVVVCAGVPRDGLSAPYAEGDGDVAGPRDVLDLRDCDLCQELLPVGSRGVAHEVRELARVAGLRAALVAEPAFDLRVSAGASTCVLASAAVDDLPALRAVTRLPITVVAVLSDAESEPLSMEE
jgi:hypothetical protein